MAVGYSPAIARLSRPGGPARSARRPVRAASMNCRLSCYCMARTPTQEFAVPRKKGRRGRPGRWCSGAQDRTTRQSAAGHCGHRTMLMERENLRADQRPCGQTPGCGTFFATLIAGRRCGRNARWRASCDESGEVRDVGCLQLVCAPRGPVVVGAVVSCLVVDGRFRAAARWCRRSRTAIGRCERFSGPRSRRSAVA